MALEQTLSIIKPDAVAKNIIGNIYSRFEKAGLLIIAASMTKLTIRQASEFYIIHKERHFYNDLVKFMTSGPIFVQVLEGEDAINKYRNIMGVTDPIESVKGTIRSDFGESIEKNAVHGSDSLQTAITEINFFFPELMFQCS